jgi:ribosome biogenesis GTPase
MIEWSFGGYLVDTPGIKTLGLCSSDLKWLPSSFPGFKSLYQKCEFSDCTHTHEVNCAVKSLLGTKIPQKRYDSYMKLREGL